MKKAVLLLVVSGIFASCSNGNSNMNMKSCKSEEACTHDQNCECWCSRKCGYRAKEKSDRPVYMENDRHGKHCYCKQWDYDHYDRCEHESEKSK